MSALSEATSGRPFSNGTEGDAWMDKWCRYCVHDHSMHGPNPQGPGCMLILNAMCPPDDFQWPEAWLPEPDDGRFFLPSRMVCGMFTACHDDGCTGDPGADDRADRVNEVTEYWIERRRAS